MATQDMVDFHCELFDRCINNCDDKEDDNDQKDFEMSKDALDVADSVKMVSFETKHWNFSSEIQIRSTNFIENFKFNHSLNNLPIKNVSNFQQTSIKNLKRNCRIFSKKNFF